MEEQFFIDEPVAVTFYFGSLQYFLERYQGYFRYLRRHKYPDHKMLMMSNFNWFFLVKDYLTWNIDLPDFFKEKNLTALHYESVEPNKEVIDPTLYKDLQDYLFQFYNRDKAVELWCPRGDSLIIKAQNQVFQDYKIEEIKEFNLEKPTITINVSPIVRPYIWAEVIEMLLPNFDIALFNNNVIQCDGITNIETLEDFCTFSKNSYITINAHDDYAYIPFVIQSRNFVISNVKGNDLLTLHKKMKTPLAFFPIDNYNSLDSKEIVQNVLKAIETFKETGKI